MTEVSDAFLSRPTEEKFTMFHGRKCRVEWEAHCDKHGPYPQRVSTPESGKELCLPGGGCPRCAEERKERALYGDLAIPPRYARKGFNDFIVTDANRANFEFMRDYAKNADSAVSSGRSLILLGNPGTGKTHLACATLRAFRDKGYSGLYTTVERMILKIRETWGTAESEATAVRRFVDVDLLVLDEVGVQSGSDNEKKLLFSVLNARYENDKPSILMGNLDMDGFTSYLGERVVDRLRENGGRAKVFDWQSFRKSARGAGEGA